MAGAHAIGMPLGGVKLDSLGVGVRGIRRRNVRLAHVAADSELQEGDVLVLLGRPAALAQAEALLLQG
ncbi:TrkA-C domain protein [compost metagenome]